MGAMPETDLYERDYFAWANETAEAIRSGEFGRIDIEALADEIAYIAREEMRSIESRLEILIGHLLKWDHQERKRTRSWAATIAIQRTRVLKLLKDSPSLWPWLSQELAATYQSAAQLAVRDTNLSIDTFPVECPYTLDEILSLKQVEL
jgi:hypothetical protein